MARRDSAPRRYADAAFEIALRDRSVRAGGGGRPGGGPPHRRESPERPRAVADATRRRNRLDRPPAHPIARCRQTLETQLMAIRADEITSIIKSSIDSFDAGVESR